MLRTAALECVFPPLETSPEIYQTCSVSLVGRRRPGLRKVPLRGSSVKEQCGNQPHISLGHRAGDQLRTCHLIGTVSFTSFHISTLVEECRSVIQALPWETALADSSH